tara:strand:+ start:1402 stop:1926 length:525 start_codon:yes stop_codon:yes gene_type:complete
MPRIDPSISDAKNNPVIVSDAIEASQKEIGQGKSRLMKSTGDAKDSLEENSVIKVMDQPYDDEKMAMLAFMNEPVQIRIATTTDKNAAQVFEVNINGKLQLFRRGDTKTLPRYFVDRMLRMKETVYSQKEVVNSEGIKEFLHIPHTALKYDFSIIRDDNPHGKSWERAVLAEPG